MLELVLSKPYKQINNNIFAPKYLVIHQLIKLIINIIKLMLTKINHDSESYKLYPRRTVQNQMALNEIKPSNRHHKEQESNYSLELRQKSKKK